jgi:hypothetical protein
MAGETISIDQAQEASTSSDKSREQSTIAFPYLDLDAAEEVSKAVYSRSGYGSCDLDELAAEMGQVISGAFRLKTGTAKIFDVIDKDGRSSVKLTDLGKQIIEDGTRRAARVEAFMRVPLYAAVYEKYKGQKLPPMKALEREMASLGVATKQTDKARQAFERSARQAGFFEAGDDRLVRPKIEPLVARQEGADDQDDKAEQREREREAERKRLEAGGGGPQDPLIVGLVKRLPAPGTGWDSNARAAWLRLATSIFDVVYEGGDGEITIEVKKTAAGQ